MDPFVAAVRAEWDDDLPRLIYADYLEERGDPRGEFIRTQVELSQTTDSDLRRRELLNREANLLEKHQAEWIGTLGEELIQWDFRRGFLEVSLSINRFLEGDLAWLDGPTVAGISVYADKALPAGLLSRFVESPRSAHVHSLNLGFEWIKDAGLALIASGQYFCNLLTLMLGNNGLTDDGAIILATTQNLPQLRCLWLRNNLIGDLGATAMSRSSALTGLRQLDISNNEITSAGAVALADSQQFAHLQCLKLGGNKFNRRSRAGKALQRKFGTRIQWKP